MKHNRKRGKFGRTISINIVSLFLITSILVLFITPVNANGADKNITLDPETATNILPNDQTHQFTATVTSQGTQFDMSNNILWMHLDNNSDYGEDETFVYDFSGSGNHGTPQGDAEATPSGKFDGAYEFDGVSDYIDCGDINELNSASALTISGWYKDNDISGHNRHFDKGNEWDYDLSAATYSNRLYFEVGNGANTYAYWTGYSSEITSGEWYHAVFVFNGSGATNADRVKIFVNGVEKSLSFGGGSMPTTTADLSGYSFTLSKNNPSQSWDRAIDEVLIWNRILSSDEILDLYNIGLIVQEGEPVENEIVSFETNFGQFQGYGQYAEVTTNSDGKATVTITSSIPGTATIIASIDDGETTDTSTKNWGSGTVGGFIIPVDKTALAQVYNSGLLSIFLVIMISLIFILMVAAIFVYKAKK